MKSIKDMSMEELGAFICSALEKEGIETVLSGGCCVEIYSNGRYTSDDVDLIDRFNGGHRKIKEVMEHLGFREHKMRRYFVHDDILTCWLLKDGQWKRERLRNLRYLRRGLVMKIVSFTAYRRFMAHSSIINKNIKKDSTFQKSNSTKKKPHLNP